MYLQFIKVLTPPLKLTIGVLVYPQQCLRYLNACWKNRSYLLSTLKYQLCCALTEKNYNAEHALIRVTKKIPKTLDSKGVAGMISMDLSKAFDCMPHDLLIAIIKCIWFWGTESKANCKLPCE